MHCYIFYAVIFSVKNDILVKSCSKKLHFSLVVYYVILIHFEIIWACPMHYGIEFGCIGSGTLYQIWYRTGSSNLPALYNWCIHDGEYMNITIPLHKLPVMNMEMNCDSSPLIFLDCVDYQQ